MLRNRFHRLICIIGLFLILVACRETEEQAVGEVSQLFGIWQGIHRFMGSAEEQVQEVRLELTDKGSFKLEELNRNRFGSGVYENFPRLKFMTLRFEESTLNDYALSGSLHDFEYELHDQEFMLRSQKSVFRLKKPEQKLENHLDGRWVCETQNSNSHWLLSVIGEEFFLYFQKDGQASILMRGGIKWEEDENTEEPNKGQWTVSDSKPLWIYSHFQVTISREKEEVTQLLLDGVLKKQDQSSQEESQTRFACQKSV